MSPAPSRLRVAGELLLDAGGRQVMLRGVNLGGDSKVPWPAGGTQFPTDFSDHRTVSFINRPFPLDEADSHFTRLRHWGFNTLRLLVTWEAVEHAGPGQYDSAFLDYFSQICAQAGAHGFYVFIDFHQDVWSRLSGGDGAPGWTFDAVGLDPARFAAADAAHVMQQRFDYECPDAHQLAYPQMSWVNNYRMPANAVMWTLFWAGREVTPAFLVAGVNVQDYLQNHLLGAMLQVAQRVQHMPHVMGFDSLNEPGLGWLGQGLTEAPKTPLPGALWTPLQALAVASGLPTPLATRAGFGDPPSGQMVANASGLRIWRDGVACPFRQAGIYDIRQGQAVALREDVFACYREQPLDMAQHLFGPYFARVAQALRVHQPAWILFAEMDPFGALSGRNFPQPMPAHSVNASHWYDLSLLVDKHFDVNASVDLFSGEVARGGTAVQARFVQQLARLKAASSAFPGGAPTLVGEVGIPFDLDGGAAYAAWAAGDRSAAPWAAHVQALDLIYNAIDALQLHSTQWNYSAGNRNDLRVGDQWNQEDLSIYSIDQHTVEGDPDSGGRAVAGFCRPCAQALQGRLQHQVFERSSGLYTLNWWADATLLQPTEIYLPRLVYPHGVHVVHADPPLRTEFQPMLQRALVWASASGPVQLTLQPAPG